MQAGFAFVESGLTRSKNSINVAIKNLTDLGISLLIYWAVGFAVMFGVSHTGLFGTTQFFSQLSTQWLSVFFLFQAMFCSTSATIVSGAVAERMRFGVYIFCTFILSSLIYPVTGHWIWGGALEGSAAGWLAKKGFVDFAGSTVVHSVGGWVSLAALIVIGARSGRFDKNGKAKKINGSDIPAAVVGVMILWFGWFGFNGGSTLAFNDQVAGIIINTALASAAAMISALFAGWLSYGKADVDYVINGSLAGLVAITANCHAVSPLNAVIIGAVGGIVMLLTTELLQRLKIDDAVGAIPVHLGAGIWGTVAVALFGDPEIIATGLTMPEQLLVQIEGVAITAAWSFTVSFILFYLGNKLIAFRVTTEQEQSGLNITEHGASTEIFDFYRILDTQARTGRLDLRVPEEPFTEIGQIARRYNLLLESLETHTVARSDYLAILDNISDGLFLIDNEMRISGNYSKSMELIFCRDTLRGVDFRQMMTSLMPDTEMKNKNDYLDLLFTPSIPDEMLEQLNPFESLEIFIDDGSGKFQVKHISIFFRRIYMDKAVIRLMGIVRDITEQAKLAIEVENMKRSAQTEMEMFYRIQHINPRIFSEFLVESETTISRMNAMLSDSTKSVSQRLETLGRLAHTLKGDAHLLELDFVAGRAHDFETLIEQIRAKQEVANEDFIPLAIRLSELMALCQQLNLIESRLNAFQCAFVEDGVGADLISWSVKSLIDRSNADTGRSVGFDFSAFRSDIIPHELRKSIKDIFVQLTRNALVHGIESEEERKKAGKHERAAIEISSCIKNGQLCLMIRDNGRGLDYERIRQKAVSSGRMSAEEAALADNRTLAGLIFSNSFSTAAELTHEAGRGFGMSVVSKLVARMRGRILVKNNPGCACEFEIILPAAE